MKTTEYFCRQYLNADVEEGCVKGLYMRREKGKGEGKRPFKMKEKMSIPLMQEPSFHRRHPAT